LKSQQTAKQLCYSEFMFIHGAMHALLEEKVLCRTLKGCISATYLEPLKGSKQNHF